MAAANDPNDEVRRSAAVALGKFDQVPEEKEGSRRTGVN
jgi:hypothetical protein